MHPTLPYFWINCINISFLQDKFLKENSSIFFLLLTMKFFLIFIPPLQQMTLMIPSLWSQSTRLSPKNGFEMHSDFIHALFLDARLLYIVVMYPMCRGLGWWWWRIAHAANHCLNKMKKPSIGLTKLFICFHLYSFWKLASTTRAVPHVLFQQ